MHSLKTRVAAEASGHLHSKLLEGFSVFLLMPPPLPTDTRGDGVCLAPTQRMSWIMDQITEHGSKPGNFSLMLTQGGREKRDNIIPSDFLKHLTYIVNFLKRYKRVYMA